MKRLTILLSALALAGCDNPVETNQNIMPKNCSKIIAALGKELAKHNAFELTGRAILDESGNCKIKQQEAPRLLG